ncbi:hypothetical protein LXA43DRAFT_1181743 [Ganoderma leucocontextum]|nr:hypothetical protein LXA43DRAFT_1181743 [Ganoderma leucocontextum]
MVGVVMHGLPFANALSTALSSLPATDRRSLSGLSIPGMCAWSAAKADEYHRYTLALRAIQNILAPIHRLPPEILSRIFVEAWQDRKSLRLTHICRIWRSLLLYTSQFWAVAIAGDEFRLPRSDKEVSDEEYLGAACLRSAPRNIFLHLSSLSFRGCLQLINHSDRITSMQISARTRGCRLNWLWKLLHTGMPRLEDLAIRAYASIKEGTAPGNFKLSTDQLPRLTRLTLPARLFRLDPSWPNTIREIALRSDHGDEFDSSRPMVSLALVLQSLEDYPRLRVLDIRDNAVFHDPHSRPPSRTFPTLELLRVRSQRDIVPAILAHLSFPSSTRVDIGIARGLRPAQGDMFAGGFALNAVGALIDEVTMQCGAMSTILGYTDGAERLRICGSFDEWDLNQVGRTIYLFYRTNAPVSRLLLTQHPSQRMPIAFIGRIILPAFPHLTHLTLHCRRGACSELLETLNLPSPPFSMMLPRLKDLTVGFATKRRSTISRALRCGDITPDGVVAIHFRECCRILRGIDLPVVSSTGRQQGYRLSRLEFFSYEEGCMAKRDPVVSHIDLAALKPQLVESGIRRLQGLVDDPIVFSGYRFLTHV